jgi:hypothetical protein
MEGSVVKEDLFLGVQEAVGSNPAVPTFRINDLRAQTMRPFCFGATFRDTFNF